MSLKTLAFPVALSPGDQLLHAEKKSKAEAKGDEVDSPHANRKIKWDFGKVKMAEKPTLNYSNTLLLFRL